MAKAIVPVVNRGDVLGQGGCDIVTNATVNAHTYVAITVLVGATSTDLDTGASTGGEIVSGTVSATSVSTDSWDSLSSLEVPVGVTIYGRWSAVTIGANDTAIVYRG
jgi:hypothetical protein